MPTLPADVSAGIRPGSHHRPPRRRAGAVGRAKRWLRRRGAIGAISADAVPVNGNRLLIGNNTLEVFNVTTRDALRLRVAAVDLDGDAVITLTDGASSARSRWRRAGHPHRRHPRSR